MGIQYTILKILEEHNLTLTFSDIRVLYEAIVGHRVSNDTVGNLLSRLVKKGLVIKVSDRYGFNRKLNLETAKTVIDTKHAVNGVKGAKLTWYKQNKNELSAKMRNRLTLP